VTNPPPGASSFNLTQNITTSGTGTCLVFPVNFAFHLNGHIIDGPGAFNLSSVGINATAGDGFIWGPGIVKEFGVCIDAGPHVAVEDLLANQCGTGIRAGNSYKIKEVRVHDCVTSVGPNIGIDLRNSAGGFIESSIVRSCDIGVWTGKNNKIWNLVVSRHLDWGLRVGGGTAVSRTVISSPFSDTTRGIDYNGCCQFTLEAPTVREGCQDGSNSVQDHQALRNIDVTQDGTVCPVVSDGHTNCGGSGVPWNPATGLITDTC
jgi:hypothetical protein